jgi:hypothetical protein
MIGPLCVSHGQSSHQSRRQAWPAQFTFPNGDNAVFKLSLLLGSPPIAALIVSDLLAPVSHFGLGTGSTFPAALVAVPEAAVDKHGYSALGKRKSGLPGSSATLHE